MAHLQEDGPPCIEARSYPYRDVIDLANALCMETRAKKLREAQAQEQARRALPYQVHYGAFQKHTQHFSTFFSALEFTLDHVDDPFAPLLVGASFDAERSGLTGDEEDARAEAMELRTPRTVRNT
jgi:hypothetical protein